MITHRRVATLLLGIGLLPASCLLASCGRIAKPSPTDAALNAPEGSTPQAPPPPAPLLPPAKPPEPGGSFLHR